MQERKARDAHADSKQRQRFREAFRTFDTDGDGSISPAELESMLKVLGYKPSATEVKELIDEWDSNGDGKLQFNEFLHLMMCYEDAQSEETDLIEAFKVFDLDNNGTIDPHELRAVMASMGITLTKKELSAMMKAADLDGDGVIDFGEFKKLLQNHSS